LDQKAGAGDPAAHFFHLWGQQGSMMTYTQGFKSNMVRRMASPNGISASALAREVGVPQQSLSRWLRDANVLAEPDNSFISEETERTMPPKRPQDKSAEEKLKIVIEAETVPDEELGAFLRRNAIHAAQLREWRSMMLSGLQKAARPSSKPSEETRKIRELEKELQRKEKALAEAAAIIILKKKVQSIWGGEDEPTDKKSGR
jgi:transposase